MHVQDKVWSRYSDDKVDIAHHLADVVRRLARSLPLRRPLRALSIGSSNEPQFRILESAFRGGLYLLDIEEEALDIVAERVARQRTDHVSLIRGDYRVLLGDVRRARRFRRRYLDGRRMDLITMHHSLYYSPQVSWLPLFAGLIGTVLTGGRSGAGGAAMHAVLMASRSTDPHSTTWLYNHFAGEHFAVQNDQDLRRFAGQLRRDRCCAGIEIGLSRSRVEFRVADFEQFMGVIWMILLHPTVHHFSRQQQVEVIEHVYEHFWRTEQPLIQEQDHLVVYRGEP